MEKETATHSSILAWQIQWMEEPGRLQSMGLQRVGHNWVTSLHFTKYYKYTLTYLWDYFCKIDSPNRLLDQKICIFTIFTDTVKIATPESCTDSLPTWVYKSNYFPIPLPTLEFYFYFFSFCQWGKFLYTFYTIWSMCLWGCFSCVHLSATQWTVACQASLSMGFSRQEYPNRMPCPPPGDLLNPGFQPCLLWLNLSRQVLYH